MQLHADQLSPRSLTIFSLYAGAFLYLLALLPDLLALNSTSTLHLQSILALGTLTLLLFGLAVLYDKSSKYALNFVIIVMALSIPFVFDQHAFLYGSVPQGIWLPFIFALTVSQFRTAALTLFVSLTGACLTYPEAFRSTRAIVESLLVLILLVVGKLILQRFMADAEKELGQRQQLEIAYTALASDHQVMLANMLNGYEYCQLVYENGKAVDFIYIEVNSAFYALTGFNDIIGKKLSEVLKSGYKSTRDRFDMYERVVSSGVPERADLYVDNLDRWFDISVYRPKADHFVALFSELTEEKISKRQLTASTHQLQILTQQAPVAIAMFDNDMNYISYSKKWQWENGRGYGQLTKHNYFVDNPDLPAELKGYFEQALTGICIDNAELSWQQRDGKHRWLKCSIAPWVLDDKSIGGITVFYEDLTEYKLTEADLYSVLEESGDAIWITDEDGRFIYANQTATGLTGHTLSELGHVHFTDMIHEERNGELLEYFALTQYAKFTRREWLFNHKSGSTVSIELTTGHLPGGRMIALGRDLTAKLQIETERFKLFQAVEQSPGSILITNLDAEIEYVNAAFLTKTGYNRNAILGQNPRILKSGKTPQHVYADLWETLGRGETWQGEFTNVTKNGQEYIQLTTVTPIRQTNGTICNYIAVGEDITGRKKGEERIFELAYFDQLTGLPNRTLLLDRLTQVIAISSRTGNYGALLFIDLDHFKNINDTLGHQKGDLMLKQVAENLMLRLREGDTVARFGGDEFIIILTGLGTDSEIAANKAKIASAKLLNVLNQNYQLGDAIHHSSASIGVAMFNGKDDTTEELLKQADMAMYKSKKAGRNIVRFFDPSLELVMKQQAHLEEDLRTAILERQFILHYQAQFTSKSELIGAEVLVRWEHPQKGMMSPALFIPFAEETGLILPIGNWVLETACNQLALWEKIPKLNMLVLAVNVSALQFKQADFVDTVVNIIQRSGANPQRLKLELTESMLIENVDDIIEKMLALKKHGVEFSLDDFGTGFSSLSFLKRLPLDQLKIDQSFIRDVHNDPNGAAIAKTIVSLGKSLGLSVIAEGVETTEQREFLFNAGCHAYQGYLFSRPIALGAFEELAQAH